MTRRDKRARERADVPDPVLDPRGAQVLVSARRTLALALEDARDPVLARVALLEVAPHPDASCLRLVVRAPRDVVDEVRAALARAKGYLRAELATDLDRRRTPELTFTIVPADEGEA